MAYVPPTFNVLFDYWEPNVLQASYSASGAVPDPFDRFVGQLRPRQDTVGGFGGNGVTALLELLVPKGTPIKVPVLPTTEWQYWTACVGLPVDPYQIYFVLGVYDVAAGFMNQYRGLVLSPSWVWEGAAYSFQPNWPYAPPWPNPPNDFYT